MSSAPTPAPASAPVAPATTTTASTTSSTSPSTSFADLGLPSRLVEALARDGVTSPFPIQAATMPDALAGRDVLGRGATGSGKSLAFLLPLVARLSATKPASGRRRPRALVLAPTRELATQLDAALKPLAATAGLRHLTVFGGVGAGPQVNALRKGVDVVVACPGRLLDHVRSGAADLGGIEVTVLDEADHMADLGFLPDVRRLLDRTPAGTQRLLFSATLDAGVDVLVRDYLHDPVVHEVEDLSPAIERIDHRVVAVESGTRLDTIADLASTPGRVVVFTRTKRGAKRLAQQLSTRGLKAVDLHGDLSQGARQRNLAAFSDGRADTLVATDIAARGIHVEDVALVVHADPPADHKAYVHRSGRTGRAGASGSVVTVALPDQLADVHAMARKLESLSSTTGHVSATGSGQARTGERTSSARSGGGKGRSRGRGRGGSSSGRGGERSSERSGQPAASNGSRRGGSSRRGRGTTQTSGGAAPSGTHSAAGFSAGHRSR